MKNKIFINIPGKMNMWLVGVCQYGINKYLLWLIHFTYFFKHQHNGPPISIPFILFFKQKVERHNNSEKP